MLNDIQSYIRSRPWAVKAGWAELACAVDLRTARAGSSPTPRKATGSAVVPVYGPLTKRETFFSQFFGASTYEGIQAMVASALEDSAVTRIVLDFDTPGGEVEGAQELAAFLFKAREEKPVQAFVSGWADSAGYWLASQAEKITITPSGEAGSIGVLFMHTDISAMDAQDGIKRTIIRIPESKADTNPYEPLTDAARERLEELAEVQYNQFVADVSRGRGVAKSVVKDTYGKGRALTAQEAKAAGMVDQIATFDEFMAGSRKGTRRGSAAMADLAIAEMEQKI